MKFKSNIKPIAHSVRQSSTLGPFIFELFDFIDYLLASKLLFAIYVHTILR